MLGDRKMILLEGNVGAGKTTLGNALRSFGGLFDFIEEPVSSWQNDFSENMLELFYSDPVRWGFTFQLAAFTTRAKTWDEVISMTDHQRVVLERSIYCDRYVFAKNCHDHGVITDTEWELYCKLWDWLESRWCVKPDQIVYLRTPASVCLERVSNRGRDEETSVSLNYLKDLEKLHDEWLLNEKNVIVIDGSKEIDNNRLKSIVLSLL